MTKQKLAQHRDFRNVQGRGGLVNTKFTSIKANRIAPVLAPVLAPTSASQIIIEACQLSTSSHLSEAEEAGYRSPLDIEVRCLLRCSLRCSLCCSLRCSLRCLSSLSQGSTSLESGSTTLDLHPWDTYRFMNYPDIPFCPSMYSDCASPQHTEALDLLCMPSPPKCQTFHHPCIAQIYLDKQMRDDNDFPEEL